MPFRKVGKDKYKSPSGKTWTQDQISAYYAKKNGERPFSDLAGKKKR